MTNETFQALVTREQGDHFQTRLESRPVADLPEGSLRLQVSWSSLNYKDALSATGNRGVTRSYPHTPGIDAAGTVIEDSSGRFQPGQVVLVTGYDLGMNTAGGYGQQIRIPSDWALPLPAGLEAREAMLLGTAGLTAGLCVQALLQAGIMPEQGPVAVSGATGGVGSIAVRLLSHLGYRVEAISGKEEADSWLQALGAQRRVSREEALADVGRPMLKPRWAAAVDTVGGPLLASLVKATGYNGAVACCGLAGSTDLPLNVFPFILRNVRLLGVDSVEQSLAAKAAVWERLASDWRLDLAPLLAAEVSLEELPPWFPRILNGQVRGRVLVRVQD